MPFICVKASVTRGLASLPDSVHEFTFQFNDLLGGAYRDCFAQVTNVSELPRSNLMGVRTEFGIKLDEAVVREVEWPS